MDVFEALADPTRRRIVEMLARSGSQPAGRIAAAFNSARPTVSRHLKVMRDAGLVRVHSVAQERYYELAPHELARVEAWLARHRRFWEERLDALVLAAEKGTDEKRTRRGQ